MLSSMAGRCFGQLSKFFTSTSRESVIPPLPIDNKIQKIRFVKSRVHELARLLITDYGLSRCSSSSSSDEPTRLSSDAPDRYASAVKDSATLVKRERNENGVTRA